MRLLPGCPDEYISAVTHHILPHTLAPSYREYQRSNTVQEEGLTNDLHKEAHDKKLCKITKCVHILGYTLTTCEVAVFSREISQLLKMVTPHSLRSHLNSSPMGIFSRDYSITTFHPLSEESLNSLPMSVTFMTYYSAYFCPLPRTHISTLCTHHCVC